jgi:predicted nucleic acid-binding protein
VIDTSQMLLLIAYEVLRLTKRSALERANILYEVRGRDDDVLPEQFEKLWLLFQRARRKVITQHVAAEAHNLCHRLRPIQTQSERIWEAASQLLHRDHIEEYSCPIADLYQDESYRQILHAIGPADAGLILTAERLKCEILSDEGELSHWSWTRLVPCLPLKAL